MNIDKQIEKILAGFWLEDYDSDEAISQIKKTILKAIMDKLEGMKMEKDELCSANCAVQAPQEDFGYMGCTCGGEDDVETHNETVDNIESVIKEVLQTKTNEKD